ncbi:MAG: ABC transporter permease [Bacteroidales bacterium]|nr:ABC transporter permease [Bacteroidales bacterium]
MWLKFRATSVKEMLLLLRDRAGLAMLFIMPMALILIMTLLQDSTFKRLEEKKLSVLVLNYDPGLFGKSLVKGLWEAENFELTEELISGEGLDVEILKKRVADGDYQFGLVIHKNATEILENKIKLRIQLQFPDEESLFDIDESIAADSPTIDIYFDPAIKDSFKQAISGSLRQLSSFIEADMLFDIYAELFDDLLDIQLKQTEGFNEMVVFNQKHATAKDQERIIIPNSVQHNVPAWTVFAMFFIVIPLGANIIKERQSGVSARLKTMPGSNLPVILGKATVYLVVGILQACFMLLIGVFVLPLFDLPSLDLGNHYFALFLITISISLAATGFGIVIGTIAKTHEQSSIFGSISVVILAAIGGIWVPLFMMSDVMVAISRLSPLNWGLNGYSDIFLRNAEITDILGYVIALLTFFMACIFVSFFYNKLKRTS